jgi:hypothetical protein
MLAAGLPTQAGPSGASALLIPEHPRVARDLVRLVETLVLLLFLGPDGLPSVRAGTCLLRGQKNSCLFNLFCLFAACHTTAGHRKCIPSLLPAILFSRVQLSISRSHSSTEGSSSSELRPIIDAIRAKVCWQTRTGWGGGDAEEAAADRT